jgi:hypothetical protein
VEVRWDHVDHSQGNDDVFQSHGSDGGTFMRDAWLLAAQAIYTF